MTDLERALASRPYPGRGVLVGTLTTGTPFAAYFLTGRSAASRARQLQVRDSSNVAVVDTSGGPHDDLRHYLAVTQRGSWLVAGNGDQVEPLAEALAAGRSPLAAWAEHTYEPDPPIFTPRIWMAWDLRKAQEPLLGYVLRSDRPDGSPDRVLWSSELSGSGAAVLMTTYNGTVTDVSTTRSPQDLTMSTATVEDAVEAIWRALDPSLRVAALAFDPHDLPGSLQLRA